MNFLLKFTVLTVLLFFSSIIYGQPRPGGVTANIGLWLKADVGTDVTTHGFNISTWTDQVTTVDFLAGGAAQYQSSAANMFNYNPTIDFDGVADYFSGTSVLGNSTITEAAVYIVHKTRTAGSGGGLFNETTDITEDGRFMTHYPYNSSSNVYWYNSQLPSDNWNQGPMTAFNVKELTTFGVSSSAGTRFIDRNGEQISTINGGYKVLTGASNPFQVGCGSDQTQTNQNYYADALIAEIAVYNGGGNSGNDLQKIESYMAIKYGITLSNAGGGAAGDYISTNVNLIWDADDNPSYHNNVIGIGRDDTEALYQRQSHTDDDVTRVYLSTLSALNSTNGGSFSANVSYIMVGDNNGQLCNTATSLTELPSGIFSQLEREWKIENTNVSETFSMDITLESCAVLGSVNIADLRLLVDSDGDFSDASVIAAGGGLSFSYNNPVLTISGISTTLLPTGGTRYFTIGSVDVGTPLPIELVSLNAICNGSSTEVRWTTLTESNNDYYTIERSIDGAYFHEVGMVQGAGNSTELIDYVWVDNFSRNSKYFYRLKQTDFDGTVKTLLAAGVKCDVSEVSIYPNPFHNNLEIRFSEPTDSDFMVQVKNSLGQIVLIESISKETIEYHLSIDNDLNNGFYYIEIFNENEVKLSEKLIRL